MPSAFYDLVAYRRSADLADELRSAVSRWDSFDLWSVGLQLMRAIDSVGANMAEGRGRWHPADRRRFYVIARGSLYEAEHWLSVAETRGLIPTGTKARLDDIARPLSGLIRRPA